MNVSDLDLGALSQALDDHDPDRQHFLDRESGSLWTFVFSESTDETRKRHDEIRSDGGLRWVPVPSLTTQQAYEEIEDFVETVPDEEAQETLFRALERKGALRNFREVLLQLPETRTRWTGFRKERSAKRLGRFLRGLGLDLPEPEKEKEGVG
jgi:hypothetical protein